MQNHGDIAGLENSSLDMLKRFYNTVTEYVDAEAEFRENFEQDLEDPVFLTDILHEDDLLEKTVDTLNDIEKIRNQYITEKDYDFFRGY